jgi:hypothetical protein
MRQGKSSVGLGGETGSQNRWLAGSDNKEPEWYGSLPKVHLAGRAIRWSGDVE